MSSNQTVREYLAAEPTPNIRIEFSPHGSAYTYNVGEEAYSPANTWWANVNTELTLTANVTFAGTGQYAIGYEWRFGDGSTGSSNPIAHTYTLTSEAPLILVVTDNFGVKWRAYKTMFIH